MKGFAAIPAAGVFFFFSAWLTMVFWGIHGPGLGVGTVSYIQAMGITIALWLVVAPLVGASATRRRW